MGMVDIMGKATNINEIVNYFDPKVVLKNQALQDFYVERESPRKWFERHLISKSNAKLLFSGHLGSGKSTELQKIMERFDNKEDFLIIFFDAVELLNPYDIEYSDVLFAISAVLYQKLIEKKIKLDKRLVNELENFTIEITKEERLLKEKGIKGFFKIFFFEGGGKYGKEEVTRKEIRKNIKPRTTRLVLLINNLIDEIKRKYKNIVIIIDSTDHIRPLETADIVFSDLGMILKDINCGFVITVPIEFQYLPKYMRIIEYFDNSKALPNPHPIKDFKVLKTIIEKRMDTKLINKNAMKYAIEKSGGLVRDLIKIVALSSIRAMVDEKNKIYKEDIEGEVRDIKNDFLRFITKKEDIEALIKIDKEKNINLIDEEIRGRLMEGKCIIEYSNGVNWDIHPIVRDILIEGKHLS